MQLTTAHRYPHNSASPRQPWSKRMRYLAIVLCSLSQITFIDFSYAASRVFADGLEDGTTNKLSFPGSYNRATVVSTARDGGSPHTGTRMLEANWNGIVAWNDPNVYTYAQIPSWNYTNEFLLRFWIRYDRDVDRKNGGKVMRLGKIGKNELYMGAQMQYSGGPLFIYFEAVDGSPGPLTYNGSNVGDNQWHKVELYVKHDTGANNGILRVWTDGVLKIDATNVNSVSNGGRWEPLDIMSNWSNNPGWEHDANNHVYWDDIEIFSDTGTGATGSLANASISSGTTTTPPTALAAPGNLHIQ